MNTLTERSMRAASPASSPRHSNSFDMLLPAVRGTLEEIDLRTMGRTIWRWRGLVAAATFITCIVAVIIMQSLTPVYTATTQVAIGLRQSQAVNLPEVLSTLKGDAETITTEIGVIRSRKLAQKAIVQLGLDSTSDFNPQPGPLQRAAAQVRAWLASLPSPLDEMFPLSEELAPDPERRMARMVDLFLDKLKVNGDGKSRIVTIAFQATDPRLASQVANTLADFYIVSQLDAKFDATRRANEWLADRLSALRQETVASEDAVEQFRRTNGLIRGPQSTIAAQEVSQVANDLVAARAKRIDAQSRIAQLRGDPNAVPEVLANPLIQKLREQEADAGRRAADLLEHYGDKHPRVIAVRGELNDIRRGIRAEIGKIIEGLRNEAATQQSREASLSAALDKLKGDVSKSNAAEVQLRDLERTAQANRTLYENFLARFKETQSQENFQQPDADVISAAAVPLDPSFPQKAPLLIISLLTGLALGALLALIVESRDVGVRSMEQVKRLLGLNPLGLVPTSRGWRGQGPEADILHRPTSTYAEAIRTVHTNLMLTDVDQRARVVLVTSSLPGEGKSTTVASLAQMAARYGQKVVALDCDLRRPRLHRIWGVNDEAPGVADWLLQRRDMEEIINPTHPSGAHLIPAGNLPSVPPNLLNSDRFQKLLRSLREHYDMVILDSAPVLSIADTRALAALADKTVFCVGWRSTPRKVAASALESLLDTKADVAGAVLTRVNVKSHAKDGFADSVYYSGKLKAYYH
jgi:polysaccharide biosynthesis transport protein